MAGPASYKPQLKNFAIYEGPPAPSPLARRSQMTTGTAKITITRVGDTRYSSNMPHPMPMDTVLGRVGERVHFPGPGHYSLQRYSQFSRESLASRNQPFEVMRSRRSDPSAVFPDRRNAMIVCKPVTPSPHFYSPVPALDRLRMSMPNSPCAMGRIRPKQGTSLDAMLRSNTNLATTLKDMQAKPPWTPATSRSPPSPSLVRMRTFTSPRSPDVMVGYAPDGGV